MSMPASPNWTDDLLVYAHIGDLHIVDRSMQNYRDFLAIVADIEAIRRDIIDFVYLPGDNADNGSDEQYRLVATGLRMLGLPVHAITGDHDMETGSLEPFYRTLNARKLPHTRSVGGVDCVFLDMSGEGDGGPDFRLPSHQTAYLKAAIDAARENGRCVAVFMHAYPSDLVESSEQAIINPLLADPAVQLVDMGHTHYNELANDGRTIFASTRSTGQVEEGPVGYTIAAIDGDTVSWRFKLLDDLDPFVLVTAPADRRLRTERSKADERMSVHAVVLNENRALRCEWRADDGPWLPMTAVGGGRGYQADADNLASLSKIEVRATSIGGRIGTDTIEIASGDDREFARDGSDRDAIGAWEERHVFGTQLGPNRNGRKW